MSRSKKPTEQPRDVTPFWEARGFRREIAHSPPGRNEDPLGEEAYQRAFIQAAKSNPPRLPNPSHYPNSMSACEYLRKKEHDFNAPRPEKRQGTDPPERQMHRQYRDPDRSPIVPGKKSSSASPASYHSQSFMPHPPPPPPPPQQYQQQYPSLRPDDAYPNQHSLSTPHQSPQGQRLHAMEPPGGAMGPMKKLR